MSYFKYITVIYASFDSDDIDVVAREAVVGDAICTEWSKELVHENQLPSEAVSFFNVDEAE